jgi:hypothetical protein
VDEQFYNTVVANLGTPDWLSEGLYNLILTVALDYVYVRYACLQAQVVDTYATVPGPKAFTPTEKSGFEAAMLGLVSFLLIRHNQFMQALLKNPINGKFVKRVQSASAMSTEWEHFKVEASDIQLDQSGFTNQLNYWLGLIGRLGCARATVNVNLTALFGSSGPPPCSGGVIIEDPSFIQRFHRSYALFGYNTGYSIYGGI